MLILSEFERHFLAAVLIRIRQIAVARFEFAIAIVEIPIRIEFDTHFLTAVLTRMFEIAVDFDFDALSRFEFAIGTVEYKVPIALC